MDSSPGTLSGIEEKALDYFCSNESRQLSAGRILLGIAIASSTGSAAFSTQPAAGIAALGSVAVAAASVIAFVFYVARIHPLKNETQEMIGSRLTGEFRDRFIHAVRAATLEKTMMRLSRTRKAGKRCRMSSDGFRWSFRLRPPRTSRGDHSLLHPFPGKSGARPGTTALFSTHVWQSARSSIIP